MNRTEMPPVSDNCNTKLTLKSPSSHFEQHKNTQCVHMKDNIFTHLLKYLNPICIQILGHDFPVSEST